MHKETKLKKKRKKWLYIMEGTGGTGGELRYKRKLWEKHERRVQSANPSRKAALGLVLPLLPLKDASPRCALQEGGREEQGHPGRTW